MCAPQREPGASGSCAWLRGAAPSSGRGPWGRPSLLALQDPMADRPDLPPPQVSPRPWQQAFWTSGEPWLS